MKQENDSPVLVFDNLSKKNVLKSLGLKEDSKDRLIDEKGFIQTNQEYEMVHGKEFGGVLRGSKIIIKKDVADLVRYFRKKGD